MVGVSASINLPLHHKVQKFPKFWHSLTQVVPEKGQSNGCGGVVCLLLLILEMVHCICLL